MTFTGVQVLRFSAAMLVAAMHITQAISVHLTGQGASHYWALGSAGVDIFFVISGFVMGLSTPPAAATLAARARQAGQFLQRRLLRVLPLYWFYTLLKVALLAAVPAVATRYSLDLEHLAASLAFMPWTSPWGEVQPVLPVGWTLNFEMLFYALFALAMLLGLPRMTLCLGVFATLIWAALRLEGPTALNFYGQSIVLEFVLGVGLARLYQRGAPIPPEAGLLFLSLGLLAMFGLPWTASDDRFLSWGLAAGLIVAGAIWMEPWAALLKGHAAPLVFLGDASYSLYLSHTFVVPGAVRGAVYLGLSDPLTLGLLTALLVVLCACLSYALLERPMTLSLQRGLGRPRPLAAAPTAPSTSLDHPASQPSTHAP